MSPMCCSARVGRSAWRANRVSAAVLPSKSPETMPDTKTIPDIKILYVEDELFLGKIVKESLESRGFEVRMESDGARVLDSFREMQPDVCVLDIMLPNKDGFEIAEEIRRLDEHVPILFVTARGRTEDVVRGFG